MKELIGALALIALVGLITWSLWMFIDQPSYQPEARVMVCTFNGQVVVAKTYRIGGLHYSLNNGWLTLHDEAGGVVFMQVDACVNRKATQQ